MDRSRPSFATAAPRTTQARRGVGVRARARARTPQHEDTGQDPPRAHAHTHRSAKTPVKALLAPALLAFALAGCGGAVSTGSLKGESKAVAERISDFQTDVTGTEEEKLCETDFARAVAQRLRTAGSDCQAALKKQLGAVDDFELSIESVTVDGDAATARVKSTWSGKSRVTTMQFVKERGAWRISGLQS